MCHDQTAPPPATASVDEPLLRAREVAERLNLHVSTIYRLADSGQIRAHRLGEGRLRKRGLRIPESAVTEYLTASKITTAAEAA